MKSTPRWVLPALAVAAVAAGIVFLASGSEKEPSSGAPGAASSGAPPAMARADLPLLFASTQGDPAHLHLFSLAAAPALPAALTRGTAMEFDPAWSPDGQRVVFASLPDGSQGLATQIATMARDGSDRKPLTTIEPGTIAMSPKWSPDGLSIAYATAILQDGQQPTLAIYRMSPDGGDRRKVAEGAVPDWSPDGRSIVFTGFDFSQTFAPSVQVVDVQTGTARALTKRENAMMPAYSPDGRFIAYMSDGGSGPLPDIYVMNADGSGRRRLTTTDDAFEIAPQWSGDGASIYFSRLTDEPVPHAPLFSIRSEGGEATRLTDESVASLAGNGAGFLMIMLTGQGRTLFEAKQP